MLLPEPRGPLTEALLGELDGPVHQLAPLAPADSPDPLADEDEQLALYLCYELHYRGLPGVDERWEWEPSLLGLRRVLEERFVAALHTLVGPPSSEPIAPSEMDLALREVAAADDGPSLSAVLERDATRQQFLEVLAHKSCYQLKEADPHTFALPRLDGPAKAAMVEIQADEYGGGRPDRVHAELYAETLDAVGLDRDYGAYVGHAPATTLATVNLMSLFGLHRRLRGAAVGHLALVEITSSVPSRRYANGLRRLGFGERATDFFDEHVTADAVHEAIAAVDLAGGLARQEPALAGQVVWGARCLAALDAVMAAQVLGAWERGESSLRRPLPALALA